MSHKTEKHFFAKHARSSAALVSLGIHAVILVIALSFVAVTVVTKEDQAFEAKPVKRPKMALKKLSVPVKFTKSEPKLRRQITVKTRMDRKMPDIKMPEITGVKGGLGGGAASGLGGAASLGFTMPEFELFGIKGKGEKVFIILDSSPQMMYDEMGGIPAYTIIKQELVTILGRLPAITLLNVVVYDRGHPVMIFPNMVPASSANVDKVEQWLKPLNAAQPGMGSKDYGIGTLGPGGTKNKEDYRVGQIQRQGEWYPSAALAMKQQADVVFLLTCWWGNQFHFLEERDKKWFESSAGRRWMESYEKGKRLLAEENRQRALEGQPPRVIGDNAWEINKAYFPNIEFPATPKSYFYQASDFAEAFMEIRKHYKPNEIQSKSGITRTKSTSKAADFSFNVIHFREIGKSINTERHEMTERKFKELTTRLQGEYRAIEGLEAIRSSIRLR